MLIFLSWEERRTPAGRVQFVNKLSKAVQWDRPMRSAYDVNNEGRSTVEIPTATIGGVFQISEASPEQPHRQRLITKSNNGKLNSSFVLKGQSDYTAGSKKSDKMLQQPSGEHLVNLDSTDSGGAASLRGATAASWPVVDRQKYYLNRNLIHKVTAENFDKKTTAQGQVYFVNRVTGQTTWNDPSLPVNAPTLGHSTDLGPLPAGWEIRTTHSGKSYFVDHNSRTTQFAGKIFNSPFDYIVSLSRMLLVSLDAGRAPPSYVSNLNVLFLISFKCPLQN